MAMELEAVHADDIAVEQFATAMKGKLAACRARGRSGWDDPARCSLDVLQTLLAEQLCKGDPVDVGNFAMMVWRRGGSTRSLACRWRRDEGDSGAWASACGERWSFIDDGPIENRVSFCQHCGCKVALDQPNERG